MTTALLARADWLLTCGCPHVAMERTGDSWKPVCNIVAGPCEVRLVNAQQVKTGPGRKTDVKDAAWRAALLPHGLWRASFIPPVAERELRDLTRDRRTVIQARVPLLKRVQQRLEDAHMKRAAVASDMMGVSGRAMLAALMAGPTAPHTLAEFAQGRWRSQRESFANALDGRVTPHPRVVLTALGCQSDRWDDTSARVAAQMHALWGPFDKAGGLLATIPGGARHTAEMIVAEIGTDMPRFPRAAHLASWAGVAPGHHDSAGKRTSGQPPKGHRC